LEGHDRRPLGVLLHLLDHGADLVENKVAAALHEVLMDTPDTHKKGWII